MYGGISGYIPPETMKKIERKKKIRRAIYDAAGLAVFILALAVMVILLQDAGLAEDLDASYVMCMPGDRVNIRLGPSSSSTAMGWCETGDTVYPDGKRKNGFTHCIIPQIEAGEGWIHSGYLVKDAPKEVNRNGTIESTGRLAARKNVGGKRTRWLKTGGTVKVYYWSIDWCVTNCGYIKSEYIRLEE